MQEARRLADLFTVAERFHRSVHIASDYSRTESLSGYVITPLARSVLMRIVTGMQRSADTTQSAGRAWSVTGPYGAGKSACMLFAAQVLAYPANDAARGLVRSKDQLLYEHLEKLDGWRDGGFVIVPVVGSRQPLAWTLLHGLVQSIASLESLLPQISDHKRALQTVYTAAKEGDVLSPAELVALIEETAAVLQSADPAILGVLVLYDELGKPLEFAALNPGRSDVALLQMLAEAASRSESPAVGLVTVLHQAFEHYAAALSPIQQREWAKVQGRFEDIGFLASPGELLTLVDEAIRPVASDECLADLIRAEIDTASALEVLPRDLNAEDARGA